MVKPVDVGSGDLVLDHACIAFMPPLHNTPLPPKNLLQSQLAALFD